MTKLQQLRESRAALTLQAREIIDKSADENRPLGAHETQTLDNIYETIDKIDADVKRVEKQAAIEGAAQQSVEQRADKSGQSLVGATDSAEKEMKAFLSYLQGGIENVPEEMRTWAKSRIGQVQGALSVGTNTSGGFTVPQEFMRMLETALKAYGGMRNVATVFPTETGADMPFPSANDTNNVATILAENTQAASNVDPLFNQVIFKSWMYVTPIILVSEQLIQDSAFDMAAWLAGAMGDRLGRGQNAHFSTTGNGTSQPLGLTSATGAPVSTAATGNAAGYTYDALVNFQHTVDPAYRNNATWMGSDSALRAIRLIKDTQGRPIFVPGYEVGVPGGAPDSLLGRPFVVNQDIAAPAANARSLVFGNLSKYYIRDVTTIQTKRLVERYADFLQIGFLGYHRTDGRLMDAGTNPIRVLQNSAT